MDGSGEYEIGNAAEIQEEYGLFLCRHPRILINPENVPESLWPLIPLVRVFGIQQDFVRQDLVAQTPDKLKRTLVKGFEAYENELTAWLGGKSESEPERLPQEFFHFSSARKAAAEAKS